MIKRLGQQRMAKVRDQRHGEQYSPGATYFDARDEALRRGDRTIGTEHLLLAMLVDPTSPCARAIGCDLEAARSALEEMDRQALSAIGVEPKISAGPVLVRTQGRLRLTPAAKTVLTQARVTPKNRRAGLANVFGALVELKRPDPAAALLASVGVEFSTALARFAELDHESQP
jgi:ATP-dependent Clp protease ATP-binding subunit ClpA